jgi:hypothetical protein
LYAAESGRLAVLQWARANGCPWNRFECLHRAQNAFRHHVVEWINATPC